MTEGLMSVNDGGGREKKVRVDYPANSRRAKEEPHEREKVEPVVTGEVVRRKRGLINKIFGDLVAEDSSTVFGYVITEVLVPAFKNAVSDAVSQGVERMLFGDARPRPASSRTAYTNYRAPFTQSRTIPGSDPRPPLSRQARATHDFNDVIIASRAEAEDVIDRLRDLINQYQVATVSDLYDLVGLTGEFTDDKWGWDDLRSAAVRPVRGGYMLHMPRTQPLT